MGDEVINEGLTDRLTTQEVIRGREDLEKLRGLQWAQSLLESIGTLETLPISRDLLFELRFASHLASSDIHNVQYEYRTGVGESSVDFCFFNDYRWLVELLSIHESEAVRRTTEILHFENGFSVFSQSFDENPSNERETESAELIRVQQKIGEKVFEYNQPTKFPEPSPNSYHMILVDCRGALGMGLVDCDYSQIAWGPYGIPEDQRVFLNRVRMSDGLYYPIWGLFDPRNPARYASYIRSRIHFLGFVSEAEYSENSLSSVFRVYWNPFLFGPRFPKHIIESFPLYRSNS